MLQYQNPAPIRSVETRDGIARPEGSTEAIQSVLDFIGRRYQQILLAGAIAVFFSIIYLLTATPSYTATATMLIDSNKSQLFQQQQSVFNEVPMDTSAVDSQVEVLKSENIALAVIKQLNLTEDPEFSGSSGGLISALFSLLTEPFTSDTQDSQFALTRQAVNTFESRLSIRRVGLTYVIEIGFRSYSPDRAAQIANAVANAYVDDQLEAKYEAARRAGTWLQARLHELRDQASAAQLAVVSYKNQNDMIDAGGRTINEQQLAELNSQLVQAQSQTADAHAKLDRIQSILKSNSPDATVNATVTDTLKNDVITKLRSQYLELAQRQSDWAARYGPDHLAVVNLRNQMQEIQNSIRNELQRIAETYKSDLEISQQREDSVKTQLGQAVSQSQVTNKAQVSLRELETNAQTYQALYDNFLQRYMESVQQQSFPITDARVISAATRPLSKSNPKSKLVLALSALLGLGFGFVVAAWREFADRVFRTSSQVESLLRTDCLALVPALKRAGEEEDLRFGALEGFVREIIGKVVQKFNFLTKRVDTNETLRRIVREVDHNRGFNPSRKQISSFQNSKLPRRVSQTIVPTGDVYMMITESPLSAFTEAIRSIKVAIDVSSDAAGGHIIGFTSSVPNEGKSSVASAVARLASHTGARTLLVDCDLRNPSLSRLLAPDPSCGLLEVLKGDATLDEAIWLDPVTHLSFLPVAIPEVLQRRLVHTSEVLASEQTRKFFDSLRKNYDYIFMDFAPLMPIVDVRASTKLVDSYIYVIEWGNTRIDYVEQSLGSARGVYEHLLGIVLNKVDVASLGRYDGRGSAYYRHGNYHRYGYTE
jgi:succinoglycan biosynthesis transport protein ExoP